MVKLKWLPATDIERLAEIDRSEHIDLTYSIGEGQLVATEADIDVPNWFQHGGGGHSLEDTKKFCLAHMKAGADAIGAFDGCGMIGIGIIRYEIRPKVAQLAFLHVSRAQRRSGIATLITKRMEDASIKAGAYRIYVSAAPSRSAVNFYRSLGFAPTDDLIPELMELEPDDIHMTKDLRSA